MKTKLNTSFYLIAAILFCNACSKQNTPEPISIQNPNKYSDEYFANLRAYKKTDHQIFFGWFAAYGNKEGVIAEYKKSASWGEHIAGLPDSMDICSLWPGIPSMDTASNNYNPIAYDEMRKAKSIRGIKMVVPTIVDIKKHGFEETDQ